MTEPNPRWKQRPPGSSWGDFGPDDQRGRMNLLTREKVLQGIAEVKYGETFCLSLPLDYPGKSLLNPARHPPVLRPTLRAGTRSTSTSRLGRSAPVPPTSCATTSRSSTCSIRRSGTASRTSAHISMPTATVSRSRSSTTGSAPGCMWSGQTIRPTPARSSVRPTSTSSARALGIENLARACVQGRAVMVDLRQHFGDARTLIGYEQLSHAMQADKVVVESGDMLCLHTGFADKLLEWGREPTVEQLENTSAQLDGRDERLLQWITDSNIVALIADNYAVEAIPSREGGACCAGLPLHEHCLFKLGVHLGEIWHLGPLAKRLRELGAIASC